MNLHEFQAKALLARHGVPCPQGRVAVTPEEAEQHASAIGRAVVKAQILAGDRGRAGGVRHVGNAAAARVVAQELLGRRLVTRQTGPTGQIVERLLVEAGVDATRELYLALMVDGGSGALRLVGAAQGGGDIEERAERGELALASLLMNLAGEPLDGEIPAFCRAIGLDGRAAEQGAAIIRSLHRLFVDSDASLLELNPLAVTPSGELIVLDAKITLEDSALFRHPDLAGLGEASELDEVELEAQKHQVNFVQMDGDIGVIVNGAGLALATLDMVRDAGGRPANFMDIRTTAKSLDIAHGIGLVLDNPKAKVLLVNVYGGGMQPCDTIVEGLGIAVRRKGRRLPIVMRLIGNNEDIARQRLANFNLPTTECADMWQAVTRAVAFAAARPQ